MTSSLGAATTREQAVKFAECMRDNGVSELPAPNASGDRFHWVVLRLVHCSLISDVGGWDAVRAMQG